MDDLISQVRDWNRFERLALRHRVYPGFARPGLGLLDRLPEPVRQRLKQAIQKNTFSCLQHQQELSRLQAIFRSANIPVMPIKGLSLAQRLYSSVALRYVGDIDLLLPPCQWPKADALAKEAGYRRVVPSADLPENSQPILLNSRHDADYLLRQGKICLELHWRWLRNPNVLPTDTQRLIEQATSISLGKESIKIPSPEIELQYLCAHGVRHRWARLMWLNDIRYFLHLHPGLDWEPLTQAQDNSLSVTFRMLEALGEPLPSAPLDRLPGWAAPATHALAQRCLLRMSAYQDNVQRNMSEELADEWALSKSTATFFRDFVLHRVLTPTDRDVMTLPLPTKWQALYPVLRPLLWILRRLK